MQAGYFIDVIVAADSCRMADIFARIGGGKPTIRDFPVGRSGTLHVEHTIFTPCLALTPPNVPEALWVEVLASISCCSVPVQRLFLYLRFSPAP